MGANIDPAGRQDRALRASPIRDVPGREVAMIFPNLGGQEPILLRSATGKPVPALDDYA